MLSNLYYRLEQSYGPDRKTLIIYSHRDTELLKSHYNRWSDSSQSGEIHADWSLVGPDQEWWPILRSAIANADAVHIVWCCHAAQSPWVFQELEHVFSQDKPVFILRLCDHHLIDPIRSRYPTFKLREAGHVCHSHCGTFPRSHLNIEIPSEAALNSLITRDDVHTYSVVLAISCEHSVSAVEYVEHIEDTMVGTIGRYEEAEGVITKETINVDNLDLGVIGPYLTPELTVGIQLHKKDMKPIRVRDVAQKSITGQRHRAHYFPRATMFSPVAVLLQATTISPSIIDSILTLSEDVVKLEKFDMAIIGPHLTPELTVLIELRSQSVQAVILRDLAQKAINSLAEEQRGYILGIEYLEAAALIGPKIGEKELRDIDRQFETMRQENAPHKLINVETLAVYVRRETRFQEKKYKRPWP